MIPYFHNWSANIANMLWDFSRVAAMWISPYMTNRNIPTFRKNFLHQRIVLAMLAAPIDDEVQCDLVPGVLRDFGEHLDEAGMEIWSDV